MLDRLIRLGRVRDEELVGGCVEVAVLSAAVTVRDPAAPQAGPLVVPAAAPREFEDRVAG
ncbi:DUF397 domain-containing protein [Amycolatopsis sp. cg5]|uniref:DUF397 domain-containing protein n=1 Tax=Amycolatopsis sp. cg5 TaxID=3238802 RepID=UPI00352337EA